MKGTFEIEATVYHLGADNAERGEVVRKPIAIIEIVFDENEDVRTAVDKLHTSLTQLGLEEL